MRARGDRVRSEGPNPPRGDLLRLWVRNRLCAYPIWIDLHPYRPDHLQHLPGFTTYTFVTRIRAITEHGMVPDPADPLRHTRTAETRW